MLFVNADTLQIKPYTEVLQRTQGSVQNIFLCFHSKRRECDHIPGRFRTDKKYLVTFFETDSTLVMEVKDIRDPLLIIDKTNFGHAGWFRFELYADGKLIEKNKLLIPKE